MNEYNLHAYQQTAIKHIMEHHFGALFMEMGLGKTVATLTAIKKLMFEELDVMNVLVIAPKRVAENVWSGEIEKWDHLKTLVISKITGTDKQRRKALSEKADIYIIGRDNVAWLCDIYNGGRLPFDMLVIDELSSFKNPRSVRFKRLKRIQPMFKRIIGLTGTPAPNGLIDLWSQVYLLDRGERLGRFISNYRDTYFRPGKRNGSIIYTYDLRPGSAQLIHDKIGDICMSMKTEDYLQLPGRMDNTIDVVLPKEIKTKYDEFEKEQVLSMFGDGKEITAVNAAVLTNKLSQFANGAIYDDSHNYLPVHDLKLEAAKELIEDSNGSPVLVAWIFRHDRDRLISKLKEFSPRELRTGKDIDDWNQGKIRVMLMHPASGGHGLNLQAGGNTIIWFGQTWSLELEQQFNTRLDRQGQTKVVIINRLMCQGTVDEDIAKARAKKEENQDGLMEAVKAKITKYVQNSR